AGKYSAFPNLYQLKNGMLYTEFRSRPSGSHIDPRGQDIRLVSEDGGISWKAAEEKVYNPHFLSPSGELVNANGYGWRYVDPSERSSLESNGIEVRDSPDGKVAYAYGCYKEVSSNGGKDWIQTELKVPREALIMVYLDSCTFLRLNDDILLRAVYGRPVANKRFYESWLLRSENGGNTWDFVSIAADPDQVTGMGETAIVQT